MNSYNERKERERGEGAGHGSAAAAAAVEQEERKKKKKHKQDSRQNKNVDDDIHDQARSPPRQQRRAVAVSSPMSPDRGRRVKPVRQR